MDEENTSVYNARLDAFTLYHLVQEPDVKKSPGIAPALPALGHALAGSLATATAKAICYPLDLVVTRLQVQRQLRGKGEAKSAGKDGDAEYTSLLDAAHKIYANEGGLKALYVGVSGEIGKSLADSFLFFLAYTYLRQRQLQQDGVKNLGVFKELGVGMIAGAVSKFFTTPLQNVVTRQQTAALVSARDPSTSNDDLSFRSVFKRIYAEQGPSGFWAGYGAALILTTNPSFTFAIDNMLQRLAPRWHKENPSALLTFLLSATSKGVASAITYPIALAKSRAQSGTSSKTAHDSEKQPAPSTQSRFTVSDARRTVLSVVSSQAAIFTSLYQIYQSEGLAGLYSGVDGEVLKGFLQHGLTMTVKENAHAGVIQTYYLLLKLTRKYDSELQKAKEAAVSTAEDAKEQVENIGHAVVDGAQQVAREGQKIINGGD